MARLELTRSPEDRNVYVLPGVGEMRTRRWPSRDVDVRTADGRTYTFVPRGQELRVPTVTDAFGAEVGRQTGNLSILWRGDRWDLESADASYYTLRRSGEERDVANLAPAPWGGRPVPIVLDETAKVDRGLVLFAMFLMRRLADDISRPPYSTSSP